MGNRKAPRPVPTDQIRPEPPPAPPGRRDIGNADRHLDRYEADIVAWLRGAGYHEAANALAEMHVESCALRKVKPLFYVEAAPAPPAGEAAKCPRCHLSDGVTRRWHCSLCGHAVEAPAGETAPLSALVERVERIADQLDGQAAVVLREAAFALSGKGGKK